MDKSVQITGIAAVGLIVIALIIANSISNLNPSNTVSANGQAEIEAMPDLVAVYFDVETKGDTSEEATQKNAEIVEDLKLALLMQGFEKKDIETQNFNVYPDYKYVNKQRTQDGYRATHRIRVEMSAEDSSKIGDVIDAGVEAGAGISYINFELSQELQNQYKAEAIKLAAQDARIKAEAIAEGLDKKLGKLVSTSDSNFNYNPWRVYEASVSGSAEDAKQATTDIQPGSQNIYANVQAVFKIY